MKAERTPCSDSFAIGVDIGGTHITTAVVDLCNRSVIEGTMERNLVNSAGSPDDILNSWLRPIAAVQEKTALPLKHLGIAMPGPFDYEEGVSFIRDMHKYDSIFGLDVRQSLADRLSLPTDQIRMRNDTEAFLEGEVLAGSARGFGCAVAVTLGTGLGTARSLNGITQDLNLGSSFFNYGIAEDYLSTRWFVKRYHELTGHPIKGVRELAELWEGNAKVQEIFHEFSENLAAFLLQFYQIERPELIVIGGNIARASDLFLPEVLQILAPVQDKVMVCKTALGEKAALIGAVSWWMPRPGFAPDFTE